MESVVQAANREFCLALGTGSSTLWGLAEQASAWPLLSLADWISFLQERSNCLLRGLSTRKIRTPIVVVGKLTGMPVPCLHSRGF